VRAWRDGHAQEIDANQLVPGDIVFVEEGDQVAADCCLQQSSGLQVNNAALTGESAPAPREVTIGGEIEIIPAPLASCFLR